jgi:hypothetical protein
MRNGTNDRVGGSSACRARHHDSIPPDPITGKEMNSSQFVDDVQFFYLKKRNNGMNSVNWFFLQRLKITIRLRSALRSVHPISNGNDRVGLSISPILDRQPTVTNLGSLLLTRRTEINRMEPKIEPGI